MLAIDTEFQREKTFFPILALIQISDGSQCFIYDPLHLDLKPLYDFLLASQQIKLFHSASQDLEIFHDLLPQPMPKVFDTQVAAQLLGYPTQISLKNLVADILGKNLLKEETVSDWTRRPLSESQLTYAFEDVIHLPDLFLHLSTLLQRQDKFPWYEEECFEQNTLKDPVEKLVEKCTTPLDSPFYKAVMRSLLEWREKLARKKNLPRNWIIKDDQLKKIIAHPHVEDFLRLEILTERQFQYYKTDLSRILTEHQSLSTRKTHPSQRQKDDIDSVGNKLKNFIQDIAGKRNIPAEFICNQRRLKNLASQIVLFNKAAEFHGWRGQLLNDKCRRLCQAP